MAQGMKPTRPKPKPISPSRQPPAVHSITPTTHVIRGSMSAFDQHHIARSPATSPSLRPSAGQRELPSPRVTTPRATNSHSPTHGATRADKADDAPGNVLNPVPHSPSHLFPTDPPACDTCPRVIKAANNWLPRVPFAPKFKTTFPTSQCTILP